MVSVRAGPAPPARPDVSHNRILTGIIDRPAMDVDGPCSTPVTRRSWVVTSTIILVLFVLGAAGSALRKPVTQGFDEVAHLSYVASLQTADRKWPGFDGMRMIDPTAFEFTAEQNYLNHPPFYYGLIAVLGPNITGHPSALIPVRLLNVTIALFGLIALLVLARQMQLGRPQLYAFAAMIVATPVLAPLAGSANNDNLGFAGGAVSLLGLYAYAASPGRSWLIVACCGMIIASAAKLTGLFLTGSTLVVTFALLATRSRLNRIDLFIVAGSLVVAAAPYLVFMLQYGSPTPDTPAQRALLRSGADISGWASEPRMTPAAYVFFFLKSFLMEWLPVLRPRNSFQLAMLALPAAITALAVAGLVISLRAISNRRAAPSDFLVVAGIVSIAVTLAAHIAFSYQRHLQSGWMMDAYPRYYLPLIAIVPMAALTLTSVIPSSRLRTFLVWFLVGAPIVFRIFGAPMG
jgi:hypothetical protein